MIDTNDSQFTPDAAPNTPETETDESESIKHVPFVLLPSRPDADPYHVHTTTRFDWAPGHAYPVCGSTRIASTYFGSTYGPVDRFDYPVSSFLAVGIAQRLQQPVRVETTTGDDRVDFLVTCQLYSEAPALNHGTEGSGRSPSR